MRTTCHISLVCLLGAALGACSPYSPDLGGQPFLCDAVEPLCPDGYSCKLDMSSQMMVCVAAGGAFVDAQVGFPCADDSALEKPERNDTKETAYQTPVATQRKDIAFAGLAICPEGDKDLYAVNTTVLGQNFELIITWEGGQPLSASILAAGGNTIATGTSNGANSIKAYAANLPAGLYFAQVFGGATTKNNYKLAIKVDP